MMLPMSGPMTAAMINVEMGKPWNAPFSITGADARALAGIPSGPIKMSDFYGKSGTPPVAQSNLVAGYAPQTANNAHTWGFDDGTSAFGIYSKCGSLTPANIPYPGGVTPCRALAYYGPNLNRVQLYVPNGYQRNGVVLLRNEYGDVVAELGFYTWYYASVAGGVQWAVASPNNGNPFVNGAKYRVNWRE